MDVGFRINDNQIKLIMQSINFYTDILKLDWEAAFINLFDWCYARYDISNVFTEDWMLQLNDYKNSMFYKKIQIDDSLLKSDKFIELNDMYAKFGETSYLKGDKYKLFTIDLSKDEIELLLEVLDLPIRIALGQWEEIRRSILDIEYKNKCLREYMKSSWTFDYMNPRELIINTFTDEKLSKRQYLGISQKVLSEDIRSIYEIYKELHYQWNPRGVYDSPPWKLSKNDDPMPMIEFGLSCINPFIEDKLLFWKNFCLMKHPINRKPYFEGDNLFLPVKQTLSGNLVLQSPELGDLIYKKLNGHYYISKSWQYPSIIKRLTERIEEEIN